MLLLAYDGTEFHGWQLQPGVRTVQECLEQALRRAARHQVVVIGCSRTDAGVHAAGYVANFYTTHPMSPSAFAHSVGSRLPKDMTLARITEVPLTFHATRSAVSKMYRYRIHNSRGRPVEELQQRYAYHLWQPLDIEAMCRAAEYWVGEHDFTSFASAGSIRETNVRTIHRIEIHRAGQELEIDIEGSGFLYKQVRNMVGTLCEIGRGHWPVERAKTILDARDRTTAGPTAPARGLCLRWVKYDLQSLPVPSPSLLEKARSAKPPVGTACLEVDSLDRSAAPLFGEEPVDEEPCA